MRLIPRRITLLAAALLAAASPSFAQQVPPYVYAKAVTTSPGTVLAANSARKKLIFHNPNDTIKVAVCPSGPTRDTTATVTAAINGAGCITILPYDRVEISGANGSGPIMQMGSAWTGVGSGSGNLTIFEFE